MRHSEQVGTGKLLSALQAERQAALAKLVDDGDRTAVDLIGSALLESNWPVCDDLAAALAEIETAEARDTLVGTLKARRHHVRSAAIKALIRLGDASARPAIEKLADDPSYEVRQDVAEALRVLPDDG